MGAGKDVEIGDVGVAGGEHDCVGTDGTGGRPVFDDPLLRVERRRGRDDSIVLLVGLERFGDLAGPELLQCDLLPGVTLSAVLPQLDCRQPSGQSGQESSGADPGQLPRVTDKKDLCFDLSGTVEDGRQEPCRRHAGFVDHGHVSSVDDCDVGCERGEGHRRDPCRCFKLRSGAGRKRRTNHSAVTCRTRVVGGGERERLPRSAGATMTCTPLWAHRDFLDEGSLFCRQRRPWRQRSVDERSLCRACVVAEAFDRASDEALLEDEQLAGRVAGPQFDMRDGATVVAAERVGRCVEHLHHIAVGEDHGGMGLEEPDVRSVRIHRRECR